MDRKTDRTINRTTFKKNLPVINISQESSSTTMNSQGLLSDETLRALDNACRNWGAFQVVGHGIDPQSIKSLQQAMHAFFRQPVSRKNLISRTSENPWGFYDRELTNNTRDKKEVYDYGPNDNAGRTPQWPSDLPEFQLAILAMYQAFEKLSFSLLSAIAVNLGLAPQQLTDNFLPSHSSFLRLNHYPASPGDDFGVNAHTDAGGLTILLLDSQPGLEIYQGGRWHLVDAREDALLVHMGDVIQVWSNDRYMAPLHRVAPINQIERFSAPFFFNPTYTTDYEPLRTMVDAANPPRYRSINWGEFRAQRTAGDYADYGEEIQISHFRIRN